MTSFLASVAREASIVPVELHEAGAWTPAATGEVVGVSGMYRRLSEVTDIGALVAADGVAATFTVASDLVDGVALGDGLAVRGADYRVVGIEPNGRGLTMLVLGL